MVETSSEIMNSGESLVTWYVVFLFAVNGILNSNTVLALNRLFDV